MDNCKILNKNEADKSIDSKLDMASRVKLNLKPNMESKAKVRNALKIKFSTDLTIQGQDPKVRRQGHIR